MADHHVNSLVAKFRELWRDGQSAHLDIDCHAGEAWVGLRLRLGHLRGGAPQQTREGGRRRGEGYSCRLERRAAQRAVAAAGTDLAQTEQVGAGTVRVEAEAEQAEAERVEADAVQAEARVATDRVEAVPAQTEQEGAEEAVVRDEAATRKPRHAEQAGRPLPSEQDGHRYLSRAEEEKTTLQGVSKKSGICYC